ncbi:hypothetical protein CYLTODRAFT_403166 [Cylindrobasidium torrendii FP15055 ss-10]|uniref:Uncharacterized protein n=1 Tax=Cylindrobasidium torrendii FP15055 ss-10 TaxID=1314674 RepID=A0A0D7B1V6_9AGAR|nr:hypothetical protein CYLTODRAFT_403166 [Cylindrobasidium torrendii FP15055 ss-10]
MVLPWQNATDANELSSTVFGAIQSLPVSKQADLLLETALNLIDQGRYGEDVENYFQVYLKTPSLPMADVTRALVARGTARKAAGEALLADAQKDFQAALSIDPTNKELRNQLRREKTIHFHDEPASQRAPPEVWDTIARNIPRYHLRSWLRVSTFHRDIALPIIFHTVDLHFGDDQEHLNRGLDFMDRIKDDPALANKIKSLRIHWAYEESDVLDLMMRAMRTALPKFKALRDFEWIGYPEMRADVVASVLETHSHIQGLGLIGWHFDAVGVSAFRNLRKFTLRAEDDDGFADMGEVRTVLDVNKDTLTHLVLGAYLERTHSWDSAFQSVTIKNLTHLDLVDTRISHFVLSRIAHAHTLTSLTLHGTFEDPGAARVVFESDHIIDQQHTFLPDLESFRFVLIGHDDDTALYQSVTNFLRFRRQLRRLDLGTCPWDLVSVLLPTLDGLRVLGVRVANVNRLAIETAVDSLPEYMTAIRLSCAVTDAPLNDYASYFERFGSLSFLHFHTAGRFRPKSNMLSEKDFGVQTQLWKRAVKSVALAVPTLDFVGWHGEHYVVVRRSTGELELKELPARKRLDCGKGVDLGGEDAAWLERKDVPMDYEVPGLE